MFKIGDVVEITEESDATGMLDFKKGESYEVIGASSTGRTVVVMDEGGRANWYHCTHFKLKEDTTMEKKECLFKEGQVVWDLIYGKGEVSDVDFLNFPSRPVCVKFDQLATYEPVLRSYTAEGISSEFGIRSLYFSEPEIQAATEPLFESVLEENEVVIVRDKVYTDSHAIIRVVKEEEKYVLSDTEVKFHKARYDFYRVGEKINFK